MWTIAAVNKKFKGPLGSYNGLTDVHLAHYFSRPSRRSHLKAAKLITDDGFIIPEKNVKGELYIDEKKKRVYDILARSILQNAVHKESSWNKKLCNYLEDISKITAVDKARSNLKKKSNKVASENIIENYLSFNLSSEDTHMQSSSKMPNVLKTIHNPSHSAPVAFSLRRDGLHKVANLKRCLSAKEHSPYIVPLLLSGSFKDYAHLPFDFENCLKQKRRKRKKISTSAGNLKTAEKRTSPNNKDVNIKVCVPQNLKFSQCKITLLYHGHLRLSSFLQSLSLNVIIKQQHCGGTPVVIYKGRISVNEMVSFVCLDHEGFFFSITVFLNGIRELKLSSCCVFRYQPGRRLGGTNGTFSIKKIEGGKPCLKCQYQEVENAGFRTLHHPPERNSGNSACREDSVVPLDNFSPKISDKSPENESEVEEIAQENNDEISENDKDKKERDDDSEEIVDELNNSDEKEDSVSEENIVDDSSDSLVEDVIKDTSGSAEIASDFSDTFVEPKKYEISIDSSSEDEGEKQHVISVSVHGTPKKH